MSTIDPIPQRYPIQTHLLRDGLVDTLIAFAACLGFFLFVVAVEAFFNSSIKHQSKPLAKFARRLKLLVKQTLVVGMPSFFLDIFSLCITIIFCILYIYEVYENVPIRPGMKVAETIIAACVLLDYVRHFISSTGRFQFWYSGWWLLTLFTSLNVLVPVGQNTYTPYLGFFRFFRIPTLVTKNTDHFRLSEFMLELLKFALTVVAALLSAAGMLFLVENTGDPPSFENQQDLEYFECFYWVVVTISTVGYGDISPKTYMGRSVIMSLIAFALYFVPSELSRLVEIMKLKPIQNAYSKKAVGHVVVVTQEATSLGNFLSEFYHPDHSANELEVVVLTTEKKPELFSVVSTPAYRARVFFLIGDPVNEEDLDITRLGESEACFLLAPSSRNTSEDSELQHLLRTISVANYKRSNKYNFSIFAQVTQAKSIPHIPPEVDHVICLESLNRGILAKSCFAPGFSTLVSNLITSSGGDDHDSLDTWWKEYEYGKALEIYTIYMTKYKGEDFIQVALKIYQEHGVILFGIQVDGDTSDIVGNLLLNPANYKIGSSDVGFIIAPDYQTAKQIAKVKRYNNKSGLDAVKPASTPVSIMKQKAITRTESSPEVTGPTMLKLSEVFQEVFNKDGMQMLQETTAFLVQMGCIPASSKIVAAPPKEKENSFVNDNGVWKLSSKQSLESCTLGADAFLSGHIIVAGGFDGIHELLCQLKSASQGPKSQELAVVVLHPEEPSDEEWDMMSDFPNVFYAKGSALSYEDCQRCRISSAHAVVLLIPKSETLPSNSDGFAVLAINHIEQLSKCVILAEFVDGSNIKFLRVGAQATEATSSFFSFGAHQERDDQFSIHFASGRIVLNSVLDFCLGQCFYNHNTMKIFEQLCGGNVEQIPIPAPFQGTTYSELVIFLEKTGLVPLGLYRSPSALEQSDYPYVVTSPPPSLKVHPEDRIFVILPSQSEIVPAPVNVKPNTSSTEGHHGRSVWRE